MTQGLNLQQQLQQLSQQSAQDFYAESIGSLKSQIQNYREQLEQYSQQLPEGETKAQIEEMTDYYYELEGSIDQAAQDQGIQDQVNEAAQSTQQKMTEFAQGAAQQVQDAAGQATDQAQQLAGQATDQAGQVAGQAQDAAGGLVGWQGADQGTGQGSGGASGQSGEPEMDDYSHGDSNSETSVNDKTPKGILGQLLNLDILPPPQSDTTTFESGDGNEFYGPS